MFELGSGISINFNADPEEVYYSAVISSKGYPGSHKGLIISTAIQKMPPNTYVTYTLLTAAGTSFSQPGQGVTIQDGQNFINFQQNLTAPVSQNHPVDGNIFVSATSNGSSPVILLHFAGQSPLKLV